MANSDDENKQDTQPGVNSTGNTPVTGNPAPSGEVSTPADPPASPAPNED